jgi:hypothetical protein
VAEGIGGWKLGTRSAAEPTKAAATAELRSRSCGHAKNDGDGKDSPEFHLKTQSPNS